MSVGRAREEPGRGAGGARPRGGRSPAAGGRGPAAPRGGRRGRGWAPRWTIRGALGGKRAWPAGRAMGPSPGGHQSRGRKGPLTESATGLTVY